MNLLDLYLLDAATHHGATEPDIDVSHEGGLTRISHSEHGENYSLTVDQDGSLTRVIIRKAGQTTFRDQSDWVKDGGSLRLHRRAWSMVNEHGIRDTNYTAIISARTNTQHTLLLITDDSVHHVWGDGEDYVSDNGATTRRVCRADLSSLVPAWVANFWECST